MFSCTPGPRRASAFGRSGTLGPLFLRMRSNARFVSLVIVLSLLLPGPLPLGPRPAWAGDRKAKQLYSQSRQAELKKDYDLALSLAEQAGLEDPNDHRYELAARRLRFVAGQAHVDTGRRLREQGHLEEALAEFQRAIELDPGSTVAAQQLRRTREMLEERSGQDKDDPEDDFMASALEKDRAQREDMVDSLIEPPLLKPLSSQPIDVTMSEQSQVIFETIGKLAGVNVLFDPDYSDKKIDIQIQNATLYEALDYVSLIARAYWKPISDNAIFITNDNTNKRREYEEEVVKTIYLNNVATPQELQEIVTAIRGLTDIRRMFPVTSMNALILRGTEAKLALAEKVVYDIDKARPEVIIDVLVLEASKSRVRELGISPVTGDGNGISIPVGFNRNAGDSTSGSVSLGDLNTIKGSDWVTTLPGAQLTALFSNSDTNLLQSPRIRASDNQQASLRIGDRIPIATGSFQPGVGGVGINPLVNTQFQYTDVGVNVDIQPKVHNDREISMHVEIEISNVRDYVDLGGVKQPVIGQRTITHDIRLEEGEASILGGLNQAQVFKTKSGVPFLGEVPLLGRFFSITRVEQNENEILVVLIPHVVRLPTIDDTNLKSVASGTDQVFTVRFEHDGNGEGALPEKGASIEPKPKEAIQAAAPPPPSATAPPAAQPSPTPTQPAPAPQPAEPQPATPQPTQPAQPAQPAGGGAQLRFDTPSLSVKSGQKVTMNLLVDGAQQLFGSPLRIRYNREQLNLVDITKGAFLAGEEATDLIFSRNIRNQVGQAAVNISRFPGTGGADGSGVLVTLTFEALAPGEATVLVTPTGARNADQQIIDVGAGRATVNVTP
ncbi:MAG: tetratricopeptide repeat protein [Acidobacteria bacterium]|nr:tetratricopeptide repeat protein [Acidobacteriota bacterium]